jgi:hypothetical protein
MESSRQKFTRLRVEQLAARKAYDGLIRSATRAHAPSGLNELVLTQENLPRIEAAYRRLEDADAAVLAFLRGA